jgi:hypothetical protein
MNRDLRISTTVSNARNLLDPVKSTELLHISLNQDVTNTQALQEMNTGSIANIRQKPPVLKHSSSV